jgi:hypothetical protein
MYALVLVSLLQAMSSKPAIMFFGCFVYLQQATPCMPIAPSSLLLFLPFCFVLRHGNDGNEQCACHHPFVPHVLLCSSL